jgi:hypothetical protein
VGHEGLGVMTTTYRPAFYAVATGTGGVRDWWTLLHPPYTAWHLSYVAIGAALAPRFDGWRLEGTLLAFLLAVGVAAHALDELHGRPLGTGIPRRALVGAAVLGTAVPVGTGWWYGGVRLLPFMVVGAALVVLYNLEPVGGRFHNSVVFAAGWGAFPVLTGYYAQDFRLEPVAVVAALGAFLLSVAQRELSSQVRAVRRRAISVNGRVVYTDGKVQRLDHDALLAPIEAALRALALGLVCLAVALVAARW